MGAAAIAYIYIYLYMNTYTCRNIGLYCGNIWHFCGNVGLFYRCGSKGEFQLYYLLSKSDFLTWIAMCEYLVGYFPQKSHSLQGSFVEKCVITLYIQEYYHFVCGALKAGCPLKWINNIRKNKMFVYMYTVNCYHFLAGSHGWRAGGLGSRPKKMYGERLGDGVEYHLMSPTPRRWVPFTTGRRAH